MKHRLAKKIVKAGKGDVVRSGYVFGIWPKHLQTKPIRRAFVKSLKRLDVELGLDYYRFDDRTGYPVKVKFSEYEWWAHCCGKFIIKQETIGNSFISTVSLPFDHGFHFGPDKRMPVIFETMRFHINPDGERSGDECERASTRDEALKNHADMVIMVKHEQEQASVSVEIPETPPVVPEEQRTPLRPSGDGEPNGSDEMA